MADYNFTPLNYLGYNFQGRMSDLSRDLSASAKTYLICHASLISKSGSWVKLSGAQFGHSRIYTRSSIMSNLVLICLYKAKIATCFKGA